VQQQVILIIFQGRICFLNLASIWIVERFMVWNGNSKT
jgi:hypothetical protein